MASNLVTLDELIDGIDLIDNEAQYGHHLTTTKKRFLGIKGLRELNLDIARSIKGKKLPITSIGTVELPDDYMDYTGIFTVNDSNQLIPLSKNDTINISNEAILDHNYEPLLDHNYEQIYSERDTTTFSGGKDNNMSSYNRSLYPNRSYGGYYGMSSFNNNYGYYRFDIEGNVLQLALNQDIEFIYLEYISNGLESVIDSRVMFPVQISEALEAYIFWKSAVYQRGVAAVEKSQLRSNFYSEKRKAQARMSKFVPKELIDSTRKWSRQQSPKQ